MSLWSSSQPVLELRCCRTDYGRHAFSVATAENWDKLPIDIQLFDSSSIFRKRLKKHSNLKLLLITTVPSRP